MPEPAPQPEPAPREVTLVVAGDVMLARGVANRIRAEGCDYPFAETAAILRGADVALANLESPLGVRGRPIPNKMIWFRAAPESVECLQIAGLDLVTVANNHILDYDTENFLETLAILRGAGIEPVGGGLDLTEARRPVVRDVYGVRVAFLAYSQFADIFWSWDYRRTFAATADLPGVAPMHDDHIAEDVALARKSADVVVAAFHWGEEYRNHPTEDQRRVARLAVDSGADIVLGFHPHAIQGLEIYKGRFIAYSLGNFVMDQERPITRESMLIRLLLDGRGVRAAEVIPARIDRGQPRPLTGQEGAQLRRKIREISFVNPDDWGEGDTLTLRLP